jgi:hypothetical protein
MHVLLCPLVFVVMRAVQQRAGQHSAQCVAVLQPPGASLQHNKLVGAGPKLVLVNQKLTK